MERIAALLASPAAPIAMVAAVAWAPITGFPTWNAVSRGRFAGTAALCGAIAGVVFIAARRLATLTT